MFLCLGFLSYENNAFSPPYTLFHQKIINHLTVSNHSIALTENGGSIISVWRQGQKRSFSLSPRHVVSHLQFSSPNTLDAVIVHHHDKTKTFLYQMRHDDSLRTIRVHPLSFSSPVLFLSPLSNTGRVVLASQTRFVILPGNQNETCFHSPIIESGFSSITATEDGSLLCTATFDGRVLIWDTRKERLVSSFYSSDHGHTSPIHHMACIRLQDKGLLVVSTSLGHESEMVLSMAPILSNTTLWRSSTSRVHTSIEMAGIRVLRLPTEGEMFLLDGEGSIHFFRICVASLELQDYRHFVFPPDMETDTGIRGRPGIIDHLVTTPEFIFHNEGRRIHMWRRRSGGGENERETPIRRAPPLTRPLPLLPSGNPILQQWLEAQEAMANNNNETTKPH